MVYFYTSGNVKMIRNIIVDYITTNEVSPHEYMKTYLEKCPEATEDAKISWIVETFLGIQKHRKFLRAVANKLSDELSSNEDYDYFIIVFHGIIYHITPTDMTLLYKCLFNLSKPLLNTFSTFLGNDEVLTLLSHIAQYDYDAVFITKNIIQPIFVWQPHIIKMAHNYAEYVKKIETRKIKPPTIPIQPNVLNRKGKEAPSLSSTLPNTPPNSVCRKDKTMVTKSVIDQRLKLAQIKNKQKASQLLNKVKNKNNHYSQGKTEKYYRTILNIKNEMDNHYIKPILKTKNNIIDKEPPRTEVKETAATLRRMNKRIQITEQQEVQWLQDLMDNCRNTSKIEELEEYDRQEKERERLIDIEKKHLLGQISHEEAVIAKKKLQDENKKKYEDFLKEKQMWNEDIENWKKILLERNRKVVEKLSLLELNVLQSKNTVTMKKKELAEKVKRESETLIAKSMKNKQEELERRINMIKEIKILFIIAKRAKLPKIVDLTESSGLGLLCEMSIAELQERLSFMKISLKEELETKKKLIREGKNATKEELEKTKESIKSYMAERAASRGQNQRSVIDTITNAKEINDLKKVLEEKRKLRMQMTN